MKAVLEFNYPDDTHKLKCALHGEEMHDTLQKIKARINETFGRYSVWVCMRHDWLDDLHSTKRRR